jgi:hypothetical protein
MASSKFFAAMALLPKVLSSSADAISITKGPEQAERGERWDEILFYRMEV